MQIFLHSIIIFLISWCPKLHAHPISDRYVLVGVIASGSSAKGAQRGIAVLRDQTVNRTLTIAVGEYLPYSQWQITQVARDMVVAELSNKEQVQIRYELGSPSQPLVSLEKPSESQPEPANEDDSTTEKKEAYDEWRTFFNEQNDTRRDEVDHSAE